MSEIDKRVLVIDDGLFEPLAHRLARDFAEVSYWRDWHGPAPSWWQRAIGSGYEADTPPLLKVDPESPHPHLRDVHAAIKAADLIVFPDVGDGDWQADLRRQGKRVWGCGEGEALELDRWRTRSLLKRLDMPLVPAVRVVGLTALANLLRDNDDLYVKSRYNMRGDWETLHHKEWRLTAPLLAKKRTHWGPCISERVEFVVEEPIPDAVEIGVDGWLIGGSLPPLVSYGYEIKDAAYVGMVQFSDKLPAALRYVQDKLEPWLANNYAPGFWSFEARVTKDGTVYLIDPCCRMGSPPGELYPMFWSNFGECLYEGADGNVITPITTARYGAELILTSDFAKTDWLAVFAGPEYRADHIKLSFSTKGTNPDTGEPCEYIVPSFPPWDKVGAIVDVADTLQESIDVVRLIYDDGGIQALDLHAKPEALDEAEAVVAKGEEYGIAFGDGDDDAPPEE